MIKKISALVIALVLCLSVVVMPVSAAGVELGSNDIAFALKWDKTSYSAGDTAVLSVYMDARDDLSLFTGSFAIGLNSAVINQTDNPIATVKANATTADWFRAYYKGADTQLSWLSSSVVNTHIKDDNTAEENALYDQYLKFTAAKDTTGGSHANTGVNNAGFGGDEFIANEPIITISFTIASDVPDSTVVRAAITSGSLTASTLNFTQTKWKYYSNPGSATTTTDIYGTAASGALEQADTTVANGGTNVTIGAASIISPLSTQIRFNGPENGDTKAPFDVRTRATVSKADFAELLGVTDLAQFEATAKGKGTALRVGFVYMADSADGDYDEAAAKAAAIAGEDAPGYKVVDVSYIQRSGDNYVWTCFIAGPDYTDGVNALAYIICDGCEPQFKTVDATTFSELYTEQSSHIPTA